MLDFEWQVLDAKSRQAVIVAELCGRSMMSTGLGVPSWCCKGAHLLLSEDAGAIHMVIRVVDASTGHLIAGPLTCARHSCPCSPTDYLSPDGCAIALSRDARTVHLCKLPTLEPWASFRLQQLQHPAPSETAPVWVAWTAQDLVVTVWGLSQHWSLLQLAVHLDSDGALLHSVELALDPIEFQMIHILTSSSRLVRAL